MSHVFRPLASRVPRLASLAAALALALGAGVAFGDVVRASSPIVVDGKLDEPAWRDAQWEHDMKRLSVQRELGPLRRKTEFAFVHDGHTLYFAMRGYEKDVANYAKQKRGGLWGADPVEVFLAPTGSHFDHYQFAVSPLTDRRFAAFYSEGGGIEPDPYAPDWRHAFDFSGKDAWTVEIAIPLSSLYMTRNANWKTTWRVNVTRTFSAPFEGCSWAQMVRIFNEPEHLGTMGGFPMRAAGDDFAVLSAFPEVTGAAEGRIDVKLHLKVHAEVPGAYRVKLGSGAETAVTVAAGDGEVTVPAAFPANGRHRTQIAFTRVADGARFERGYPVLVDYRPIRVKLTVPQYRDNFYPGQNADRVAGEIALGEGVTGEVTLEGPGFAPCRATVTGRGAVDFATKGFRVGTATLRVKTAKDELAVPIRRLAPTGHLMTWVENGYLVENGRPVLRRNVYALGYRSGKKLDERYEREMKPLVTTELGNYYHARAELYVKEDATRDVRPGKAYFEGIDRQIEAVKDKDFLGWYISDEPECSGISPVYLRHIYEHLAKRDPYHVVFMASRGGKAYLECADLIETHPYLSANNAPDGTRSYGTPPWKMGDYVDAFGAQDRPDKVIGYLPTAFAYRWIALTEDYPTFDEYRCCTWAAMMRGGKTLWPYAGHDLGDRPGIWDGTICIFESFRALQDFILLGARTTFAKTEQVEGARYALPEAEMIVLVNKKPTPATIEVGGVGGTFREFRGARVLKLSALRPSTFDLRPFEVVVATTKPYDAGLRPIAEVRAKALAEEYARTHRDNQLLERDADIVFESNFAGSHCGTWCKLFDGAYEQLARSSEWKDDCRIQLGFRNGLRPRFDTVRVHGSGLFDRVAVSVLRDGKWTALKPAETVREKYLVTLRFAEPCDAEGLRFDFPGDKGARNGLEIYELELPQFTHSESGR